MSIAAVLSSKGREVATIVRAASLGEAAGVLRQRRIGALVVLGESGEVEGVVSERDLVAALADHGDDQLLGRSVESVMTSPAITVTPSTPVLSALALMTARRVRHLPVTESDQLLGIVSIGDLVKYRMDHMEREAEAMRHYIQSA